MITTCTSCSKLFEAGSEEQAYEPGRTCRECFKSGKREKPFVPPLEPTAVTMPASLASLAGDVERACKLLENIDVVAAAGTREQLVNSADALRHIAELSAGALGSLARSGIKPSPLSPVLQESRS